MLLPVGIIFCPFALKAERAIMIYRNRLNVNSWGNPKKQNI